MFNTQKLYVLPTQCICVFCVDLTTEIISLYNTGFYNRHSVYCAVRTAEHNVMHGFRLISLFQKRLEPSNKVTRSLPFPPTLRLSQYFKANVMPATVTHIQQYTAKLLPNHWGWPLTTNLGPSLRMSGSILPLSHTPSWRVQIQLHLCLFYYPRLRIFPLHRM